VKNEIILDITRLACFTKFDIYIPNLCIKALVQLFNVDPAETEPVIISHIKYKKTHELILLFYNLQAIVQMLFTHFPAGSSIKQLIHYGQVIRNSKYNQ
jgi:hypothetical protein